MAVGIAVTSHGGHYNGRITLFVVLSCMMAGMGGVIFGYDIGISGKFVKWKAISPMSRGDLNGFISKEILPGVRAQATILAGGAAFLIGSALGGAAFNVYMVILGRILLGVGVGFANQAVPLYLSEMAPPRYRGAINNGFQFSIGVGALSANLINFGTEKIKGETPNSLIQRSKDYGKAELMLQRVRGTNDVQAELDDLQVTGINVIAFYAPVLFRAIGLGVSASLLSAVVTGVVGMASTFISMLIVDKLGRRVLFLVGGIQMLVSQIMVGGILAAELGDHGGVSKVYAFLVLLLICVYVAGFGWSWGPLGWLVPSEIFPLEIRSAGQSITVAVSFIFTFIVAQTFLSMLCHFKSGIFFFFGGWVVLMTAFVYYLLPETKSIPIEQMDRVWKEHWFWKRIVVEEPSNPKMETA
ncbi:Hexose carrier protein HEX6 [Vitis vinifera]|uniref:Hexose carrier protein HEX6 n=1 Tax=Vitis vinifera TaxID=29760 RepID=A0A438HP04_VITVI|nr:Hexose carrier protein HEX6 [Vitis vinifera]